MCTLAAYCGLFAEAPLVVAANRDELLQRPTATPSLLRDQPPRAFGGRDLQAGGTWLGVSETGLVVGMLNRQSSVPPDPARRSRGQLCLDLLTVRTAADAETALQHAVASHLAAGKDWHLRTGWLDLRMTPDLLSELSP